ncbi:hypothetical protein ACHAWF_007176, partial [Thalassiosira exigua]
MFLMITLVRTGQASLALKSSQDATLVQMSLLLGSAFNSFAQDSLQENIRRTSRAPSTRDKRQKHNERFVLFLYLNSNFRHFLDERFLRRLEDIDAEPDYSSVIAKNGEKKTLEERKQGYRLYLLHKHISHGLGEPGLRPRSRTVDLNALESNVDAFLEYCTNERRTNGGILKGQSYASFRTSLAYLFRQYNTVTSREFKVGLKEAMNGVKRYTNECNQAGEGNIEDGKRGLTWALYGRFNQWFLEDGSTEGVFACLFSKLTCYHYEADELARRQPRDIPFFHLKDSQTGAAKIKKLPRHCYINPLNESFDLLSSLLHYLALNPDTIVNEEEALFKGSLSSQSQRFGRFVQKICQEHRQEIEEDFGFDFRHIGVHSWRKCAHTKLNTGITTERASDTYCGRILQGLPEHLPEFAVSYPDFVPIDPTQSITDGVAEEAFNAKLAEVNAKVRVAIDSIFGKENLDRYRRLRAVLRIGLASHLIHLDSYNRCSKPGDAAYGTKMLIPRNSPLRQTPLFTSPLMNELKEHVRIAMPWEKHHKYFKDASGLPPHVMIYATLKGMDLKIDRFAEKVPERIEQILDDRQMMGNLSLKQISEAVGNGPHMQAMARDMAALKRMLEEGARASSTQAGSRRSTPTHNMRLRREYKHRDGVYRRVPSNLAFPKLPLQGMYLYWHCGDEEHNIPPMKYFDNRDVDFICKRARSNLRECGRVMRAIDKEAASNGNAPREMMIHVVANTCFTRGESAILALVPNTTTCNRSRNVSRMRWGSVVKYDTCDRRDLDIGSALWES